jgi:murein lipoprotein
MKTKERLMKRANLGLITAMCLTTMLLMGGCASSKEFKELQAQVNSVSDTANAAKASADAALKEAQAASAAAARAEQAALDAKAASDATNAKIDSMFKASMQKG